MKRALRFAAALCLAWPGACTRKPPDGAGSVRPFATGVYLDVCGFYGDSINVMEDTVKLYRGKYGEIRELTGRSGDTAFFGPIAFLSVPDDSNGRSRYYFAFNSSGNMETWRQAMPYEVLPSDAVIAGKEYGKEIQGNRNACVDAASLAPEPPADFTLYDFSEVSVSDLFRIRGIDSALQDLEIDSRFFTGFTRYDPDSEDGTVPAEFGMFKVRDIYGGKAEAFHNVPVTEDHLRRLKLSHSQLLKAGASLRR